MKLKHLIILAALMSQSFSAFAQVEKTKMVDNGGAGLFQAVAVKETGLSDFVIYHPKDMAQAIACQGKLPLLIWGNGGCMDSSAPYEHMLTEIASHGYVVVAVGEMEDHPNSRKQNSTEASELRRGLEWMLEQNSTKGSDYYHKIDTRHIAAAGHSCGGAQVFFNATDHRLTTCIIMNAGMGDMNMAGAGPESVQKTHTPILYVTGGPTDVAYENAKKDYSRISHVPVVWADHAASGHGGTYHMPYGGDYGRVVVDWLNWHLKNRTANADIFLGSDLKGYTGWTVQSKNW